jgi:competence protein ComEA
MEDMPRGFDFDEFLRKYRYHLLIIFVGLILSGLGFLFFKKSLDFSSTKVEILSNTSTTESGGTITAEIAGAVITPGVYKLPNVTRVDDLLIAAGGFSGDADRVWTDKYLNRASKISDGQKVYIPFIDKQSDVLSAKNSGGYQTTSSSFSSDSNNLVNINTASLSQLDSLPGIGPVYAQKIIEHRPYSKSEELATSGALTQTLYEKVKNLITIY